MGGAVGLVVRVTPVAGRRGLLVRTEGRLFVGVTGGWVMILPPSVVGWNRRLGIVGRGCGAAGLAMGALRPVVGWNRRPMRIRGRFVGGVVGLVVRLTPVAGSPGLLMGTRIRWFVGGTVGWVMIVTPPVVGWNCGLMRIGGRFVGGVVGLVVRLTPVAAWRGLLVGTRVRRFVGGTAGLVMGALRLQMG